MFFTCNLCVGLSRFSDTHSAIAYYITGTHIFVDETDVLLIGAFGDG